METVRSSQDVDRKLGLAVRDRRIGIGMTQDELAQLSGVTFQQIQKYEHGANRISFSRLVQIARALGCRVAEFAIAVDEPDGRPAIIPDYDRFHPLPGAKQLLQAYVALSGRRRAALLEFLEQDGARRGEA